MALQYPQDTKSPLFINETDESEVEEGNTNYQSANDDSFDQSFLDGSNISCVSNIIKRPSKKNVISSDSDVSTDDGRVESESEEEIISSSRNFAANQFLPDFSKKKISLNPDPQVNTAVERNEIIHEDGSLLHIQGKNIVDGCRFCCYRYLVDDPLLRSTWFLCRSIGCLHSQVYT